jgi:putative spermidine/putrescine transport system ATP-binding protein
MIGEAARTMPNTFTGTVEFVSYLGAALDIHIKLSDADRVIAQTANRPDGLAPALGDRIALGWPIDAAKVFAS